MTTAKLVTAVGVLCVAILVADTVTGLEPAGEGAELQESLGRGWQSYQRYCQNCHGEEGQGDGRISDWLTVKPADLTQLSERNDGVFPEERVIEAIDGRREVALHGARDMPIWGQVFQNGPDPGEAESAVQERIGDLVLVLRSIDREPGAEPSKSDEP